jgi:hypothetical protein
MTVLTNSTGDPRLMAELGRSGWALTRFCGLSDPPAVPKPQPVARLKDYWVIPPDGPPDKIVELHAELKATDGGLRATGDVELSLAFYRNDYVLTTDPDGEVKRSDFLRGSDGKIAWLRDGAGCLRSRGERQAARPEASLRRGASGIAADCFDFVSTTSSARYICLGVERS